MNTKQTHEKQNIAESHKFSSALPAFDAAMKKIVATPKAEVDKREKEEKARKLATE